jgi:hypothetical protein
VNFSNQPPSKQWSVLKFRGETIAEVWFKPDDNPIALLFRIPQSTFQIPGIDRRLTVENLLKAVGLAAGAVESWRDVDANGPGVTGSGHPLAPPPPDITHLNLFVSLKPSQAAAAEESRPPEVPQTEESDPADVPEIDEATWQFLEARWTAILGLEAGVDNLRISMEGLRAEMDVAARKTLPLDVKVNALSADVAQWTKAKSRLHYAAPKAREFIHRATWATGTPERKKLMEFVEIHIQPRVPFPRIEEVLTQFEGLLKDRQALYGQGMAAYQECKSLAAECQTALRTLQSNAAANASRKSGGLGSKGKSGRRA